MDKLTEDIRKEAPWDMVFADNIVLSRHNHRELEEDLEIRRNALERRGLKVSRSNTKYFKVGGADVGEELTLKGDVVKRLKHFKCLDSTGSSDGRCEEEVRRRIQAGWMSWKKVSGVVYDRKLSANIKGKIYQSGIRPAMLYEMETVAMTKKQVGEMEVAELKMVRWTLGVTKKDKIRNEYVRGTAKIAKLGDKLRGRKVTLVQTREEERRRLRWEKKVKIAIRGKRKRGRPKRRCMDLVRKNMEMAGAREGDKVHLVLGRRLSRCGDPE